MGNKSSTPERSSMDQFSSFELTGQCVQKFVDLECINGDAEVVLQAWENYAEYNDVVDDFDVSMLDEDKMMSHMLDCYAALCAAQQYRVQKKKPTKLNTKTQQAKNKVFKTAMSLMSTGMTHDDAELVPKYSPALSKMVNTFPTKKIWNERGWMPLHWATLALGTREGDLHGLTQEDVILVYACNPLALSRHHLFPQNSYHGCTPAHFLCMQPVTTSNMTLLRYFSTCNLQALISRKTVTNSLINYSTRLSLLHTACEYGQPTEELLQFLLQMEISQTHCDGYTPLGHLCRNNSCNERLITCLLDVDSSAEVVGNGIRACIYSEDHSNTLEKIDLLLKANPEAAKYRGVYGYENLLQSANRSTMPSELCIDIMKRILAIHPDAVKEVTGRSDTCPIAIDDLPVHTAVKYGSLEAMEFLLSVYPESATMLNPIKDPEKSYDAWEDEYYQKKAKNLLHLVLSCDDASLTEAKVRFLCSRYPQMLTQRGGDGNTPFHQALLEIDSAEKLLVVRAMCEIGGGPELVRVPAIHPAGEDEDDYDYEEAKWDHWLPLHFYVASGVLNDSSPISEFADFFRLMLRWYPEAAGVAGTYKKKPYRMKTPYQLAIDKKLAPYYLRLLLRAAHHLHPTKLYRLNYAERRMAMFLTFRAVTADPTPLLMARLRFENKDLVKRVVSFL